VQNPKLRYFEPFELFDHTGALLSLKELLDISRDWEDKEIKGPP